MRRQTTFPHVPPSGREGKPLFVQLQASPKPPPGKLSAHAPYLSKPAANGTSRLVVSFRNKPAAKWSGLIEMVPQKGIHLGQWIRSRRTKPETIISLPPQPALQRILYISLTPSSPTSSPSLGNPPLPLQLATTPHELSTQQLHGSASQQSIIVALRRSVARKQSSTVCMSSLIAGARAAGSVRSSSGRSFRRCPWFSLRFFSKYLRAGFIIHTSLIKIIFLELLLPLFVEMFLMVN